MGKDLVAFYLLKYYITAVFDFSDKLNFAMFALQVELTLNTTCHDSYILKLSSAFGCTASEQVFGTEPVFRVNPDTPADSILFLRVRKSVTLSIWTG
jgi:hypothetical protein